MNQASIKEIKQRFAATEKQVLARWEKANPKPAAPEWEMVRFELKKGKATIDEDELRDALKHLGSGEDWGPRFFEVISTPAVERFGVALVSWQADRSAFEEKMSEAKAAYLDRVLFDHESPYLLLKDFKNWSPEGAR
jgi:hypothetical protein